LPRRCRQDTADQVISREQVRNKLLPAHPNGTATRSTSFANAVGKPLRRTPIPL
jgi:hypothetical protein